MKEIMLLAGLGLLGILAVAVIIIVIRDILRKKKAPHRQKSPPDVSPQPGGYHSGTVLMDSAQGLGQIPQGRLREGKLCHYGGGNWPEEIRVSIREGGVFSIGRFDVRLGRPVSDFEFEPSSKAVSRRHAEIALDAEGFLIQDLGSLAGTVVNGVALERQAYYRLLDGFTISFGNAGADYIWRELPENAAGMEARS